MNVFYSFFSPIFFLYSLLAIYQMICEPTVVQCYGRSRSTVALASWTIHIWGNNSARTVSIRVVGQWCQLNRATRKNLVIIHKTLFPLCNWIILNCGEEKGSKSTFRLMRKTSKISSVSAFSFDLKQISLVVVLFSFDSFILTLNRKMFFI